MERWGVGKMMVLSLHCIHFLRLNLQQEFRLNVGHQAELMGFCQTRKRQHRGGKHDLDTQKEGEANNAKSKIKP
nr:MAG TPA: hypothetical protein [Caudoviricetes sp.]